MPQFKAKTSEETPACLKKAARHVIRNPTSIRYTSISPNIEYSHQPLVFDNATTLNKCTP